MAADNPKQSISSLSIPWWTTVLMALACYALLKYFIPTLQSENIKIQGLIKAAPTFAPLVAIPFLLLAAKQLYDVAPADKQDDATKEKAEDGFEE
jgi:hypothetical protein